MKWYFVVTFPFKVIKVCLFMIVESNFSCGLVYLGRNGAGLILKICVADFELVCIEWSSCSNSYWIVYEMVFCS